ncbi:alginate export family protein [Bdellovibrio bacteriovorus]|uniref:alginate export family protein n=1 Tax=Bdellovibrio bacteriovorus TaxID=959 RepID=UPI0021D13440|nr:alginate export family protein [Bdellovibrio bacteriovorus]UXR64307.1 alginate export family protein [Bdellovibrio bacteriovorus]
MLNKNLLKALGLSVALLSPAAHAMSLDWSGGYRFEWTEVDRPSLGTPTERKAYGTNYLYLSPKVVAADGVNVVSRFDILNSQAYPNSQLGDIWGLNTGAQGNTNNQGSTDVKVSQLYLTVNQEYGALIVGRAPFDFGLGMTYSSGKGMFDHWYDTRDMVAYKIVVGDWFFMPSLGRKQSTGFGQGGSVTTMGFQLQYESEENKSLLGIYQETTKGVKEAVNYSAAQIAAYGGDGANSNTNIQRTNFVLGRGFDSFDFKFEAGFQSGETGVTNGTKDIGLNGYGLAMEFNVPAKESKWDYRVRLGMATGNDSSNDFGGYAFNRNYDVAMLLFNHRLGGQDFLNTNVVKDGTRSIGDSADDESISNTIYFAPSVNYAWSERIDLRNTLVYAQLMQTQNSSVDSSKDLGLEWDIDVVYKHSDRIQWVNQVGLLFPGEAWKNGTGAGGDLDNGFTFGFASKAAISF